MEARNDKAPAMVSLSVGQPSIVIEALVVVHGNWQLAATSTTHIHTFVGMHVHVDWKLSACFTINKNTRNELIVILIVRFAYNRDHFGSGFIVSIRCPTVQQFHKIFDSLQLVYGFCCCISFVCHHFLRLCYSLCNLQCSGLDRVYGRSAIRFCRNAFVCVYIGHRGHRNGELDFLHIHSENIYIPIPIPIPITNKVTKSKQISLKVIIVLKIRSQ